MSDINNNNAAGSSSSGNNPAPPHEAASSPAIEVTRTRSLEQDQPAAQDADISQESPGKGQSQRVQWTSDVHPSAANQEANNSHDSEETAIDPDTLAKLKESAQGVTEAHRPPAPATTSHAGPIGVANTRSEYFNFEGMDSEMVIPEGETDGLPSAKARKAASRKQKAKPKAFGARLKSLFGDSSGDSQPDSTHDPEKGPAPDQSGDVSSEDEEQDTHVAAAQGQSFSVLGNLMALRDADNSGASTPATNNSSIDLTQTRTEERPRPDLNSAASSPVKEKDVGEANLTEPTATSTSLQTPNSGSEAKPRRNDKSSNSLFSLKGHPAFLDKPGKMFASAAQSALSTPGGVARSVAKNMKTDSGAAKKRRRERKKDMIRAKLAAIVERQQFIMKLTRALMMFGSPSHRLEALITNTGTFLECPLQCVFTPGVMTMSFIDPATRTSETKFIKQGTGLDLRRLPIAQKIYRHTMHGRISVKEASDQLDELMLQGPSWNAWQTVILGMFASAWITPLAFGGGLVDALGAMLLGGVLVAIQMMVSKVESYANIFEIFASAINSFLASALASTDYFCFSAVTSGSVVLILPGFIVLCGSLELTARNISAGSVRMFYAIIYSLLLGFGLSLGSQTWYLFTSIPILGQEASSCAPRSDAAWWLQPAPDIYRILFAPMFMLFLALRNQATFRQKELYLMILIGSAGYCVNYFVTSNDRFSGRADFSSALGCFTVGFLGNLYSRFTNGNGFAVMAPGVLFQLPSGLSASGGLLTYASTSTSDANLQSASQQIGQTLISIAIGITVGLFFASALVNPQSGTTRKQAAFFAF